MNNATVAMIVAGCFRYFTGSALLFDWPRWALAVRAGAADRRASPRGAVKHQARTNTTAGKGDSVRGRAILRTGGSRLELRLGWRRRTRRKRPGAQASGGVGTRR